MRRVAAVALVLTAAAAARGEDGVSADAITLGVSAPFHGAAALLGVEEWRGYSAYFDEVNARGGVNGRKLRVIGYDDGYEPLYSVANTLRLIDKDKVFALFAYVGTPTLLRALPVMQRYQSRGLFLFADFTGAQPQREPPYDKLVFNIRASYREETAGLVENLLKNGFKKIGIFMQDDAYGKSGEDGVVRALAAAGAAPVGSARYRRGMRFAEAANEQVRALTAAGADAIISIGAYQGCAAFIRDARNAGFHGPIANISFVGADALLDLLIDYEKHEHRVVTERLVISQVVPNWADETLPFVAQYRAAMARFGQRMPEMTAANGKPTTVSPRPYSFTSLEGYLDARLFCEIARRAGRDLTRANFIRAAETMDPIDLGLGASLDFRRGHQALHQVWYTTVKNGKLVTIADWRATLR